MSKPATVTISYEDAVEILDACYSRECEDFFAATEEEREHHPFHALFRLDGLVYGHDGDANRYLKDQEN